MTFEEKLKEVQKALQDQGLDGWLLYDFRRSNELACLFLGIPGERLLTRRFFYWIPRQGEPCKIVHRIEDKSLDHLPGSTRRYSTWQELEQETAHAIQGAANIAMEYSPRNALPYTRKWMEEHWKWCAAPEPMWSVLPICCSSLKPDGMRIS